MAYKIDLEIRINTKLDKSPRIRDYETLQVLVIVLLKLASYFSAAVFAIAIAEDKKVPPRHPLQRLARLTEFSEEILNDWFDFLPSKDAWIQKFATNAGRMERNFLRDNQRCGYYDENQLPHGGPERKRRAVEEWDRYDREHPDIGIKEWVLES